jgi:hypothetical protein
MKYLCTKQINRLKASCEEGGFAQCKCKERIHAPPGSAFRTFPTVQDLRHTGFIVTGFQLGALGPYQPILGENVEASSPRSPGVMSL